MIHVSCRRLKDCNSGRINPNHGYYQLLNEWLLPEWSSFWNLTFAVMYGHSSMMGCLGKRWLGCRSNRRGVVRNRKTSFCGKRLGGSINSWTESSFRLAWFRCECRESSLSYGCRAEGQVWCWFQTLSLSLRVNLRKTENPWKSSGAHQTLRMPISGGSSDRTLMPINLRWRISPDLSLLPRDKQSRLARKRWQIQNLRRWY